MLRFAGCSYLAVFLIQCATGSTSYPCSFSGHPALLSFDEFLRSAVSLISNYVLSDDQWLQASLPIKDGGLGIKRVSSLATSAFLASAACEHSFLFSPESWLLIVVTH